MGPGRAAILLALAFVAVACGDDAQPLVEPSTTTAVSTTTTTTTVVSTTTTTVPVPRVTVIHAARGGGSGEVEVQWDAVADVTGYRVLRATAAAGPFSQSAAVDVLTGETVVAAGVTNIFSDQQTFFPAPASPASGRSSERFSYVEVTGTRAYFQVVAYRDGSDGPPSPTVCAAPNGASAC